jgi:hypothetical protein
MSARRGVRLGVLAVTIFGSALAAGASAAPTVTIGQSTNGNVACTGGLLFQTATAGSSPLSYTVPAGKWNITSWSTDANALSPATAVMGIVIVRPSGDPPNYVTVGESTLQDLVVAPSQAGSGVSQTFNLAPNTADPPIAVQGGDLLGFWMRATGHPDPLVNPIVFGCADNTAPNVASLDTGSQGYSDPEPSVGTTLTVIPMYGNLSLDISVTLERVLPTAAGECKGGGWMSFSVFKNQGDCVSFVTTGADGE